ncbi:MAG TPA: hypothetical protein VFH51_12320, partial [Myxococcota bacterium]|nr:hypothetical protein [Myxococcota bacterium]
MKWRRTLALLLGCLLGGCGDPPQMPRGVPAALPRTPRPFLQPCEASAAGEPAHVLAADAVRPPLLMAFFAERGLFVSADEGRHWEGLTPAGQCHLPVASFLTNASWPLGLCVQARGADNDFYQQIYCSQDGARTWRQLFAPLPYVDFATPPVLDPRRPGRLLAPVWSFGCNPHAADNPWAPPCESLVV